MRRPFIAGNWKMHKMIKQAIELVNSLKRELADFEGADIVVCPPHIALSEVADVLVGSNIGLGAQNVYWEKEGAFTGEVSAYMAKDAGCKYVIVGHSERRKYFLEDDEAVNKKIKAVQEEGLLPVFCLGETLKEREQGKTLDIVTSQLEGGMRGLSEECAQNLVIAYEPVWAIGTGKTATPKQAQEVHGAIRQWLKENYSESLAAGLRVVYGGSVKPANIKELMGEPDIDGALVGGASLESVSFAQIAKGAL